MILEKWLFSKGFQTGAAKALNLQKKYANDAKRSGSCNDYSPIIEHIYPTVDLLGGSNKYFIDLLTSS